MAVTVDPRRAAVLALHWQVNVIKPEGFFGSLLSEPVARSGVVQRAARFHESVRAAGVPVIFTRFTVPVGEGGLVRNTEFMKAVGDAQEAFRPDAAGDLALTTAGCLTAEQALTLLRCPSSDVVAS